MGFMYMVTVVASNRTSQCDQWVLLLVFLPCHLVTEEDYQSGRGQHCEGGEGNGTA